MAFEIPLAKQEYPDHFHQLTFGPIAAARTGSDEYALLMLVDKNVVIDQVKLLLDPASGVASEADANTSKIVWAQLGATLSGAPDESSIFSVTDVFNLNGLASDDTIDASIGSSQHNIVNVGSGGLAGVYLYTGTAATSLAGMYVHIRYRERLR